VAVIVTLRRAIHRRPIELLLLLMQRTLMMTVRQKVRVQMMKTLETLMSCWMRLLTKTPRKIAATRAVSLQ